jgi:hypothetical protein
MNPNSSTKEMVSAHRDAQHVPLSRVDKLRRDAAEASELRALSEHPDVVALEVERVRSFVDVVIWVGIGLGLAFTMTNVQLFAAAGAAVWSIGWLAAWLLDPMVSLVLVAVLRAEQVTARYQVDIGIWGHRTKVFAFIATYVMNTWSSWAHLSMSGIVLHSVPPILIFCAAETAPQLRDRLTTAVMAAAKVGNREPSAVENREPIHESPTVAASVNNVAVSTVDTRPSKAVRKPVAKKVAKPRNRVSFEDYLTQAREAYTPGIMPTLAWVRELTGCSQGSASKIVAALREHDTAPVHHLSVNTPHKLKEVA